MRPATSWWTAASGSSRRCAARSWAIPQPTNRSAAGCRRRLWLPGLPRPMPKRRLPRRTTCALPDGIPARRVSRPQRLRRRRRLQCGARSGCRRVCRPGSLRQGARRSARTRSDVLPRSSAMWRPERICPATRIQGRGRRSCGRQPKRPAWRWRRMPRKRGRRAPSSS